LFRALHISCIIGGNQVIKVSYIEVFYDVKSRTQWEFCIENGTSDVKLFKEKLETIASINCVDEKKSFAFEKSKLKVFQQKSKQCMQFSSLANVVQEVTL
jgi:hypothetical protein